MFWLLSFLPRRTLQMALYRQWRRSLTRGERVRLDHWGTAGSAAGHHEFQWADDLPSRAAIVNTKSSQQELLP